MARDHSKSMIVSDDSPDDSDDASTESTEIGTDDLFHVLQNERRRRVLRYLVENGDGPYEMRTVAEHVAAEEHDTTVQALTSDQRQRVYIALYQSHLPKLDEKGFIDYNQSRGVIEKLPLVEETAHHLTDGHEEGRSDQGSGPAPGIDAEESETSSTGSTTTASTWERSYAGVTAFGVLLVSGAWTNVITVGSGLVIATVLLALFVVLGVDLVRRRE